MVIKILIIAYPFPTKNLSASKSKSMEFSIVFFYVETSGNTESRLLGIVRNLNTS